MLTTITLENPTIEEFRDALELLGWKHNRSGNRYWYHASSSININGIKCKLYTSISPKFKSVKDLNFEFTLEKNGYFAFDTARIPDAEFVTITKNTVEPLCIKSVFS